MKEKELARMLQKGEARIDVRTGKVFNRWANEFTGESIYLGTLRRKAIPDRRRLEKEADEKDEQIRQREERVRELDQQLREGIIVNWTPENSVPEWAERYNLHMGHVYRIMIAGSNPADTMNYDGRMTRLRAFMDNRGFTIHELVLEDGLMHSAGSERIPFERETFRRGNYHLLGFGSIIDEKGFYRAREIALGGKDGR